MLARIILQNINKIRANNEVYPERKCKVRLAVSEDFAPEAENLCKLYLDVLFEKPVIIKNYFDTEPVVKIIDNDFHSLLVLSNRVDEEFKKDKNVFEFWHGLSSKMNKDSELKSRLEYRIITSLRMEKMRMLNLLDRIPQQLMIQYLSTGQMVACILAY